MTAVDLPLLPLPAVIEEAQSVAIADAMRQRFLDAAEALGVDAREEMIVAGTPGNVLIEGQAYRETLIRARINGVYRSRLVYFAQGADLDHVGEDHGLERLTDETDAAFRERIRIHNRGQSAAGPDDWWRKHALEADVRVVDVAVRRTTFPIPGPSEQRGAIRLYLVTTTDDPMAVAAILANVRAVVGSTAVRGTTTSVTVEMAEQITVSLAADVWMYPDAAAGAFAALEPALRAAWAAEQRLGWAPSLSWISAQLQRSGVHSVAITAPAAAPLVAAYQVATLGTVTLTNRGTV